MHLSTGLACYKSARQSRQSRRGWKINGKMIQEGNGSVFSNGGIEKLTKGITA